MSDAARNSPKPDPWSQVVALSGPERSGERSFELVPDAVARAALAKSLAIPAVRKLRFTGTLRPAGRKDWHLAASLGATVVQPCSVTLVPVTTRIDEEVTRRYLADMPEPEPGEVEMPEDDTVEPLPETLDLGAVMAEALALALPDFPRAEGVEMGPAVFSAPGVEPLTDESAKPLAGLAQLRDKLTKDE